jgi:D12 class N6 adenine-specific DNA methyltransferase
VSSTERVTDRSETPIVAPALSRTPHPRGVDRHRDTSGVDPRPLKARRYAGSKTRLLPAIGSLPPRTQRIVEPYLGPGALALNATRPAIGYEINRAVREVW